MRNTLAIAQRELRSYFFSAVAYVVTGLFVFLLALFFALFIFKTDQAAELRTLFSAFTIFVLVPTIPAISMRLISDELNRGTIETLMTSPISDLQVILGKWLGALGFFVVMLLPTLLFVVVLEVWSNPDYGPIVSGYVGLILVAAMMLAIGIFASALSPYQIIAFLVSVVIIVFFTVITLILPRVVGASTEPLVALAWSTRWWVLGAVALGSVAIGALVSMTTRSALGFVVTSLGAMFVGAATWAMLTVLSARQLSQALAYINVSTHYNDFTKGLIDLSDIVFFLSGTALFLALATKALESRRWR